MVRLGSCWLLAVVLAAGARGAGEPQRRGDTLPFSCEVFSVSTTAAILAARFGAANVQTARVPWGGAEGDFHEGTVLFGATPGAKLEIYWRDRANQSVPEWVSVRGNQTRWRSPAGITLGTSLHALEQLNAKPFRLTGFGSDVSGTVLNWSGGRLDSQDTQTCRVRVRVGPDWEKIDSEGQRLIRQVGGEVEYSSGHPAMQALNPEVHEMFLQYTRSPAGSQMEPPRR